MERHRTDALRPSTACESRVLCVFRPGTHEPRSHPDTAFRAGTTARASSRRLENTGCSSYRLELAYDGAIGT